MIERRLLAKNPKDRYQDMAVVAEDLQGVLDNLDQAGSPEGPHKPIGSTAAGRQSDISQQPGPLADSQNITVTPLPQARTARILLFFLPVFLVSALLAVAMTIGFHVPDQLIKEKGTEQTTLKTGQPARQSVQDPVSAFGGAEIDSHDRRPFSNIEVDPKGRKLRVFQFPEAINLGRIVDRTTSRTRGSLARGKAIFAADQQLKFVPSSLCTNSPSYFRRFRSDDLYEIDLSNNYSVTSETINFIDHLSELKKLTVSAAELDNDCIPALEQLKGLTYLDISNTEVSGAALAKLKTLKQLDTIRVNQLVDVNPLISALQKSTTLRALHLDATKLTKKDLEHIATFPNLEELSVCATTLDLPGLETLSHCPKLSVLAIVSDGFRANVIPCLKKFSLLRELKINCDNWSPAEIGDLKRSLPLVRMRIPDNL
jgi:hypothetical protein